MSRLSLEKENTGLKQLLANGVIYINYWGTDCDGCSSANNTKFTNMEAFYKWLDNSHENAEGSWGWEYTTEDNLDEMAPRGYWGM